MYYSNWISFEQYWLLKKNFKDKKFLHNLEEQKQKLYCD